MRRSWRIVTAGAAARVFRKVSQWPRGRREAGDALYCIDLSRTLVRKLLAEFVSFHADSSRSVKVCAKCGWWVSGCCGVVSCERVSLKDAARIRPSGPDEVEMLGKIRVLVVGFKIWGQLGLRDVLCVSLSLSLK